MSRIMVVVEFELKPEHRSQFIELIKGHAQRSRAGAPPPIDQSVARNSYSGPTSASCVQTHRPRRWLRKFTS
jgi:hypothetical protein